LPEAVKEADFQVLKNRSPFLRTLDPSESLILVGVARIDGELVATVRERESRKTHVLSTTDNEEGWRVVGVEGNPANLATVAAKIAVAEEVFTIRYDQKQLSPPPPPPSWRKTTKLSREDQERVVEEARNYRDGIRGDGHRGRTPPELANALSQISQRQREEIIARVADMRNRGASSEARQAAISHMVERTIQANRRQR
jgi:hypothetical protein